jgi:hypothetical protein
MARAFVTAAVRCPAPARTSQRSALNISRNSYFRCGALLSISVRQGTTKLHSSSHTSVGWGLRVIIFFYYSFRYRNYMIDKNPQHALTDPLVICIRHS